MNTPVKETCGDKSAKEGSKSMSSDKLRNEIEGRKRLVDGLSAQRDASQKRIVALEAERKKHIGPARVKNNPEAQKHVREIAAELSATRQALEDDKELIDDYQKEITETEYALALAEWEEARDRIRELLESRLTKKSEQRLAAAVENVRNIFAELSSDYDEIAREVKDFDHRLNDEADAIKRLAMGHAEMISVQLEGLGVPSPLSWQFRELIKKRDFLTTAALVLDSANMELGLLKPICGND